MTTLVRASAIAVAAALAGCPATPRPEVPRLPADGDANVARPRGASGGEATDRWTGRDLLPAPAPIEPRPLALPPVHHLTLASGLEVVIVEDHAVPYVTMQLAIKAGRRHETRPRAGLASVTAAAMMRGTTKRPRAKLDAAAEAVGASTSSSASYEATILGCSVPRADLATCTGLLGEVVATPALGEAQVTEAKNEVAAQLRQAAADPAQLATLHLQNALWGDDHVRGWVASELSLAKIGRADVVEWHRTRVRPNNAVLLVVGDVDRAALEPALGKAFAGWKRGEIPAAPAYREPALKGLRIRLIDVPGSIQGQVRIGQLGVGHKDEDFLAVTLVNHLLGGSSGSRLALAVKDKLGASAAASSSFDRNLERGALVAAGVAPSAQLVALTRVLIDEIARLAERGPSEAEVARAVSELAGGHALRFDASTELGNALLAATLHGVGDESVRDLALGVGAVGVAGARAAAARRLDGDDLVVTLVGDGAMVAKALKEAGLTFERVPGDQPIAGYDRAALAVTGGAPAAGATEAPAVSAADEQAARAVLDAALARKGGDRLAKLRSLRWKGDAVLTMQGNKVPAAIQKRLGLPDKLRLDLSLDGGKLEVTTVLSGGQGWARQAQGGQARVLDFPKEEIAAAQSQIWRDPDLVLLRHREEGARVAPEADVELDGVACHAIRVTSKAGRSVLLYVDKKTRQLAGMKYSEQGQTAEERFGGWKKVGGLEIAHKRSTRSTDVDIDSTLKDVVVDGPIDAAVFARPSGE